MPAGGPDRSPRIAHARPSTPPALRVAHADLVPPATRGGRGRGVAERVRGAVAPGGARRRVAGTTGFRVLRPRHAYPRLHLLHPARAAPVPTGRLARPRPECPR